MKLVVSALLVVLPAFVTMSSATAQIPPFKVVNGQCTSRSIIATGPVDADLRKLARSYSCDSVVISVHAANGSVMFQFASRNPNGPAPLGYAGRFETPYLIKVERVYLKPEQAVVPNEGWCRLWNGETTPGTLTKFTAIMCSAQIDQGNRRTVPHVLFRVR